MFCSPPLPLTPKDNQLLGMVVTCGPSLGPSRVGPPFLLSEPNTNYFLAAAPPPPMWDGGWWWGGWEGLILGWSGTLLTSVGTDGGPICVPACPSDSLALQPPTPAVPFTFFFPQKSRGGGGLVG